MHLNFSLFFSILPMANDRFSRVNSRQQETFPESESQSNPPPHGAPPSTKKALYLRPPGHHLLSSLRLSGAASLHSAVPEVTPAHDGRHADSLTAEEKTLSLGKNEDGKG